MKSTALSATADRKQPRADAVVGLIGDTPCVPLRFQPEGVTIWAKCEFLNPSGSVKDRFASAVIEAAENSGQLHPDSIILECTSGNTGVSLAMIGAAKGYRVHILMSHGASQERRQLIRQLGADLTLFVAAAGYRTGIDIAEAMAARDSRIFLPRQFENPLNAADHEHLTGPEIVRQIPGRIDAFVAGYGTGGTLAGVGKAIKARYPQARIVAMEPAEAAMLLGECPCCHWIEGIAGGFLPPLLRDAPLDGEMKVTSVDAMSMTKRLNREFGLLVGTSSGANVSAALRLAKELGPEATVATLLCDRAERYFSTRLFQPWESTDDVGL
jgi:cysteine synthase A